jgi:tetratricopeptide (TPR) repeat protein
MFSSIVQWYIRADKEVEGVSIIEELANLLLQDETFDDEQRAHLYNQLGMLLHHADQLARAVECEEKATMLNSNEPAYVCNLAQVYVKLGSADKAMPLFEKALSMSGMQDADHLYAAIEFYAEQEKHQRAGELMQILEQIDPVKAEWLRLSSDITTMAARKTPKKKS